MGIHSFWVTPERGVEPVENRWKGMLRRQSTVVPPPGKGDWRGTVDPLRLGTLPLMAAPFILASMNIQLPTCDEVYRAFEEGEAAAVELIK